MEGACLSNLLLAVVISPFTTLPVGILMLTSLPGGHSHGRIPPTNGEGSNPWNNPSRCGAELLKVKSSPLPTHTCYHSASSAFESVKSKPIPSCRSSFLYPRVWDSFSQNMPCSEYGTSRTKRQWIREHLNAETFFLQEPFLEWWDLPVSRVFLHQTRRWVTKAHGYLASAVWRSALTPSLHHKHCGFRGPFLSHLASSMVWTGAS